MISDWNTLRALAIQGYNDGIVCLATILTIERYMTRRDVTSQLWITGADKAADVLVQGAFFRLHLLISRAFAKIRKNSGDLHLRVAMNFLAEEGRLDDVSDPSQRGQLARVLAQYQALDNDPRLKRILHMRNKLLAHWAKRDPSIELPDAFELFAFARETANVWENLAAGSGGMLSPMEDQVEEYRKSAEVFWSAWNLPAGHPGDKIIADYDQLR